MIWLIHVGGDRPVHLFMFDSGQSGCSWKGQDTVKSLIRYGYPDK
jgi:hypothetical protein